jgi:hypothetical protein
VQVTETEAVGVVDNNGVVTALKGGTGIVTVKVGGFGVYAENSTTVTVIVHKFSTEMASSAVSLVYNADKYLIVNLTDAQGNPIAGVNLAVDLNGVKSVIKNIYFGKDSEYVYFRFVLNRNSVKMAYEHIQNQIAIYFANNNERFLSPIRFVSKNENVIYPILMNQFSKVQNPDCRRLCVIASYNTGAGNVSRAFTGNTKLGNAFPHINKYNYNALFNHLTTKLNTSEARNYVKRVSERREKYLK